MTLFTRAASWICLAAIILTSCEQRSTPTEAAPPAAPTPSPDSVATDQPSDPRATLTASPNPAPVTSGMGKTTVTWNSGRADGAVYVVTNAEPENLFAQGATGSSEAPWIQPDAKYEFRLYSDKSRAELLRRLTVTAAK